MLAVPPRHSVGLLVLFAFLFSTTLLASSTRAEGAGESSAVDLALVGVHVVDVEEGRVLRDRTVLVDDGRITAVIATDPEAPPAAETVVEGQGAHVIPGLLDMHAHIRGNGLPAWISTDWMMPLILAHGVTGVRDMASDCDGPQNGPVCLAEMRRWQEEIERGDLRGPRLLALSTFPVNPPWDYEVTEEQIVQMVDHFAGLEVDLVKVYDRLSPEAFGWLMAAAKEKGLAVAGHVPLAMTVEEASQAGLASVEHARDLLFDCFPGTAAFRAETRSNMPAIDTMAAMVDQHDPARCRRVFEAMKANDTWYVPTHVTRRMDALAGDEAFRTDPRTRFLPPPMLGAWLADADRVVALDPSPEGRRTMTRFYEKGLEITGAAHSAGVSVLVGTDGGDSFVFPGAGVHDELAELVKAGLTPAEALRAATSAPAKFLGLADELGTVEADRLADLVLLEGNPLEDIENVRKIRAVVFRGELLDRDELDGMLDGVEEAARRPLGPEGS